MAEQFKPTIENRPTEYFNISESHPEYMGKLIGEILNETNGPSLYITREGGRRLTRSGQGDIVIMDISNKGWAAINNIVQALGPETTIKNISRALTEADFITWDKPSSGN